MHHMGTRRHKQEKALAPAVFVGIRRQPLIKTAGKDWLF
jgi:hypothetical protein